jgi:hypothetical protein
MRVALIGPPSSGKSTLFAAIAQAGGSHVDLSRPDQPHLAMVKAPDDRLDWLARHYQPKKVTHAEMGLLDLPGLDLSDPAGRTRARVHWAAMRQSDMLLAVVRAFENPAVPAYRNRIDPRADVQELREEMLFADLDQVTARIEKLESAVKKPTPHRDEQLHELDLMNRLGAALEQGRPIAQAVSQPAEDKLLRSFAFLSHKPALAVLNVEESQAAQDGPDTLGEWPCLRVSARIEQELSQLAPPERAEFLADLGLQAPAHDRLVRACYRGLNLVSFLTMVQDEFRAWTIPAGTQAVEAAGEIHSDMARGFIRAETVAFEDLRACGDMKRAKAAGKVRLEGKTYVVQDGDVITFRFAV